VIFKIRPLCVALIALASVILAPCSAGSAAPNPDAAIRAASVASGFADALEMFPEQPGQSTCRIHGGGPYPGFDLPGTCETSAVWNGTLFLVTFTQVWDATVFCYTDLDSCSGQLSHSWQYRVDGSGNVKLVRDWGDFPPQYTY
jgi:hypothetical protein